MNRQEKAEEIQRIQELLDGAQLVVLTEYSGLAVSEMVELRQELRKVTGRYRIVKNTLAKLATKDSDFGGLDKHFKGPIAMAFTTEDPAGVAKALMAFKKTHPKFKVTAGLLPGGSVLGENGVEALSTLPGKDQLRAMLLGTLAGVPRNFVSLMAAPARNFVGVLEARRRQLSGEDAAA
ncbi:MAG: 50S ribosomal protein L10 [Deltaproteobacteria bacterium]|nr:MAG: 50S ribosomal protein L10 [Deltaproteobacteria bacterium]